MPNQIQDAPIRAKIHADMALAWTGASRPKKFHDGPPLLPKSKTDLPYSIVSKPTVAQERGAGVKKVDQKITYALTYFGAWPTVGTIVTEEVRIANLLIAVLSAAPGYGIAADRMIHSIEFDEGMTPSNEPYYEVAIVFEVTVIDTF